MSLMVGLVFILLSVKICLIVDIGILLPFLCADYMSNAVLS